MLIFSLFRRWLCPAAMPKQHQAVLSSIKTRVRKPVPVIPTQQERVARLPSHPTTFIFAEIASRMSPSPPQQVERTVHLDDQSRQFDTQATIERRAGRRKPLQRRRRTPMNRMARLFSRRTRSGSSTASATNRRTCDRGRIPQPNRIRLWPSVGRHSFPQHRPHGAAEYQREAHGRMRG